MNTTDNEIQQDDADERQEWEAALQSVVECKGPAYAATLLDILHQEASRLGIPEVTALNTPYWNTIPVGKEALMPDDGQCLVRLTNYMRWNAIALVMRAGRYDSSLGGHIASYASAAYLYEVGFQHFFHAPSADHGGDCVYIQGHSSPGIYARAFLEGRLTEQQLEHFRREIAGEGLSSYPHPWLMPDFWQFATVSMGLGPLMAIYQAQFFKYLHHRGVLDTAKRKVWMFCGDGEMGEPESMGALTFAGREQLDNLIFVINCNLQSLDGPVHGNSQIIQEFESSFRGAGWHVIKAIWGRRWAALLEKDTGQLIQKRLANMVDGEFQNYGARGPAYLREHFFGENPALAALVADWSDEALAELLDAGHDPQSVFAAYAAAVAHTGQPTVVLIKTVKGYGMGNSGEGQNATHQTKKLTSEDLLAFRDRFDLPFSDEDVKALRFMKPPADSPEMQYLQARRKALGGYLPQRNTTCEALAIPDLSAFQTILAGSGDREVSTTMVFGRFLAVLLKDKNLKARVVPILADESRTFGMEGLFRQLGIYSPRGQQYTPVDHDQLMYYRQSDKGQLLQQGISEAGAMSSWIAAATSYATSAYPMIPFYIYYSMFGYQRFGDLVWAAGDMQARGFILGGTAGRTTLNGEGLQHQDGHNLLMFSMVPNCRAYDPSFGYEVAVILQDGLRRMFQDQENIFYYVTLMNENYPQPAMQEGIESDILRGMYLYQKSKKRVKKQVQLLGAGTILLQVIEAAALLEKEYGVAATVWSVPGFCELRRDIESVERYNRLHPEETPKQSHVAACLEQHAGPVIAATDYMRLVAEQIRPALSGREYYVLGTDGYGRSDTRAALRDFFEVDAKMIVYTALKALADRGEFDKTALNKAIQSLKIDTKRIDPWLR